MLHIIKKGVINAVLKTKTIATTTMVVLALGYQDLQGHPGMMVRMGIQVFPELLVYRVLKGPQVQKERWEDLSGQEGQGEDLLIPSWQEDMAMQKLSH